MGLEPVVSVVGGQDSDRSAFSQMVGLFDEIPEAAVELFDTQSLSVVTVGSHLIKLKKKSGDQMTFHYRFV